eukprot:augustus_masked-scaffold_5-processed-gene-6.32-mRNA-1 protein AED:0.31 eAED:1.00 QI:0/-1/0/1/-1/1/1/0/263
MGKEDTNQTQSSKTTNNENMKLTVVLDLDEVLVHSYDVVLLHHSNSLVTHPLQINPPKKAVVKELGLKLRMATKNKKTEIIIKLVKRPGVDSFLEELSNLDIDVVFWTASERFYADTILNHILPEKLQASKRFYRSNCNKVVREGGKLVFFKDLRSKFSPEKMRRVIMLDDNKNNFITAPDNGIECLKWTGKFEMEPVDYLAAVLEQVKLLVNSEDVAASTEGFQDHLLDVLEEKPVISTKRKIQPRKSIFEKAKVSLSSLAW